LSQGTTLRGAQSSENMQGFKALPLLPGPQFFRSPFCR